MSRKLNAAIPVIGIDVGKKLVLRRWPRSPRCYRAAAEVVTQMAETAFAAA